MKKYKHRRKPRGTLNFVRLTFGKPEESGLIDANFPDTKDQIENEILKRFLKDSENHPEINIKFISQPKQNIENDLDFSIQTSDGECYFELMEFAPLENERGGYDSISPIRNPYYDANWTFEKLKAKSNKYGEIANRTILLIYITDENFKLGSIALNILKYWTTTKPHGFKRIYIYMPLLNGGIINVVFPSKIDTTFDPEEYKNKKVTQISNSLIKINHSNGANSVTIQLTPMQCYESGLYIPSRLSQCPCGSGLRFKHCHGKIK